MAIDTQDPEFEEMISSPVFQKLGSLQNGRSLQQQAVMEWKQKKRMKVPKTEDVLGNALNNIAETGRTAFQVGQGAMQNLPQNIAENPMSFAMSGAPGVQTLAGAQGITGLKDLLFGGGKIEPETTEFSEAYMKPQSDLGQIVGSVGNLLTSLINPAKMVGNIPESLDLGTVGKVQKAFGPWKRKNYGEYGRVLKDEAKELLKTGKGIASPKETDALVSSIKYADSNTKSQLPKKAIEISKRVGNKQIGLLELIKEKTRLARTLSAAERTGKVMSERSRVIGDSISNIEKFIAQKMPKTSGIGEKYGKFVGIRDFIQNAFAPQNVRQGVQGTSTGTKTVREIGKMEPAEKLMLSRFTEQTGVPIMGPSRVSSGLRGTGSVAGKIAPWAGGAIATKMLYDAIRDSGKFGS